MEKRYQVFISSTFTDLKVERQAVLKSILELDHMPAGMELFPATDASAWELIEEVIDNSDYYVLIIGGRYGTLDEEGIGYTEKEYDYAHSTKKSVIALLHKNPEDIARGKTEIDQAAWKRLKAFRAKVERKHTCVYWESTDDLRAKVIVGLTREIKRNPAVGWVRADNVPSDLNLREMLSLKNRVAELEAEALSLGEHRPAGTEGLAQGEEEYEFSVGFTSRPHGDPYGDHETQYSGYIFKSWNAVFAAVAPCLIQEAQERTLRQTLQQFLAKAANDEFSKRTQFKDCTLKSFNISSEDIDTCLIQLQALGLIKPNDKKRSIKDTGNYWTLTSYGKTLMVQLRAIRKESDVENDEASITGVEEPILIATEESEKKVT